MRVPNEVPQPSDSNHVTINSFGKHERQRYQPIGNAIKELIKRAHAELERPVEEKIVDGADETEDSIVEKEVVNDQAEGPLRTELPTATDVFCGRAIELLAIAQALDPEKPGQKGIVLCGICGSGKTQLVLRHIEQHRQLYTAIIWINASTAQHTMQSFTEAASMISVEWPPRDIPLAYIGSDDWRKVISRLCSTRHTRWLLILDSVDDMNQDNFRRYIPSCNHGSIVVTSTQSQAPDIFRLRRLEVDRLDLDSGRRLLLTCAFGSVENTLLSDDDSSSATAIVTELHGLPLAIEQAGALLKTDFSLPDFIDAYRVHYRLLMNRYPAYPAQGLLSYDKQRSITTVFDMLYISTKRRNPEAAALLTFMAILGPWQIPMSLISQFQLNEIEIQHPTDKDTKALMTALNDHAVLRLALDDLASVFLVKVKRDRTLSLHGAVCEWCIHTAALEKQDWIIQVAHGLAIRILCSTESFSSAQDLQSQTIERSYLAPLDRCKSLIDKHISPVALSPPGGRFCVAYAEIAARLAQAYLYEGRLEEAKTCFHTAIESEMISQGDLWPSTETSFSLLRGLATACQKLGGLEDAEELRKSALTLSEKLYNRWDPRTAAISSHLSAVSQRRETMLQRHKSAPVATTGLKLPKEIRQTARTPDNAPARTLPSDNEEDYRELLEETRQTTRALENASVRIFPRAFQTRDNEEEYHELPEEVRQTARTQENSFARIRRIFSRAFQTRDNEEDYRDLALRQRAKFSDELLIASYEGDESMAKSILGLENLEVNSKDKYGRTPLLQAADGGYEAIVKLLLVRKDVVADSKDMYGCTPLFRAAGKGHKAIVKLLVARNDIVADSKAVYGRTPLSWAAERGHEAVVKLLVVRDDVLADSKDAYGRTPLSWAAENGHEAVVKLLLARNDVIADSKDNKGRTPLIRATWRRHEAIVKLLLAHNDVIADSKAVYGRTPLSWAAERGHDTVVKLLRPYATAELPTTPGIYELA
ncbi:hypothetical protein LTR66_004489 [Elasticomyces elasticus]|nr:hypothetical protein LTR66_004489 [Elasticomyces elasticus]